MYNSGIKNSRSIEAFLLAKHPEQRNARIYAPNERPRVLMSDGSIGYQLMETL
jgi:hypothetical protein